MLTPQQQDALARIAAASVAAERATGCPAELSAAQAIIESGWLSRCPGNNCFGIKPDHHGSGVQYFASREFLNGAWVQTPEAFEQYASLDDCFTDHARLIVEGAPYAAAWTQYQADHQIEPFIAGVAHRYATDPDYAIKIIALARGANVAAAIAAARQG